MIRNFLTALAALVASAALGVPANAAYSPPAPVTPAGTSATSAGAVQGVTGGVAVPVSISGSIIPIVSAAAESSHILKASPGTVYGVYATNLTSTAGFLLVFNATSAPADGAVTPTACVPLPASQVASVSYNPGPAGQYTVGIVAVLSSGASCFTKTTGTITGFISGAVQ